MRAHRILLPFLAAASLANAATFAYRNPDGRVVYRAEGSAPKIVSPGGYDLCLRPDGKALVYTSDEPAGANRSLVIYDAQTGKSRDLARGLLQQPVFSGTGEWIAFLRYEAKAWQVWRMPVADPSKAVRVSAQPMAALAGWTQGDDAIVCFDQNRLHWMGLDGKPRQSVAIKDIYGSQFQWMSSDRLRQDPANPGRLLLSAYYMETPKGAAVDEMDLNSTLVAVDPKSGRRTPILPVKVWAKDGEWSADGAWIYFTRLEPHGKFGVWRVRPDGAGLERVAAGSEPAAAR